MGIPIPDQGTVTEDTAVSAGGKLTASGDINYLFGSDAGEWVAETLTGALGSTLVIDDDGVWDYEVDNSAPAIQALDTGETITETFTVTSNGGTSTITITIQGLDEPPCFVEGTLIDTPHGPRLIEDLRAGDAVLTRDNGVQHIRWAGSREIDLSSGENFEKLQPIRIRKDALGRGVPDRDLLLSPQHRVLVRDPLVGLITGEDEVFCPARQLVNGRTVLRERRARVRYFHLLFDDHQVLCSSGCDSESFLPGAVGLSGFEDATREEVLDLFPDLRSLPKGYGPTARYVVKRHEALLLSDRLLPPDQLVETLRKSAA